MGQEGLRDRHEFAVSSAESGGTLQLPHVFLTVGMKCLKKYHFLHGTALNFLHLWLLSLVAVTVNDLETF